ncbi:exosome complex exonuclease rrp6 [Trichoderma arundinaceum]|uniref:Exosome complex exonuclease rrp6 n=1 Tax=Trichoderma arundinaceum TaxID=490622 RepID=A0A395NP44_TRIAR|nr:exosome complex exonuclease rrp6 [Trichoderma arundinaceum]
MDSSQDFNSLQEEIQKSLISTVKSANRIASQDLSFQRTVNPDVAEQLDEKTSRILDLSTRLLNSAARACGIKPPKLEDPEDVDMNWRTVVDVVDSILEKADRAMDEYTGLVKQRENGDSDSNTKTKQTKSTGKVIRNANVKKPQLDFEIRPNNFPDGPWKPLLTEKPHAKVPLDKSLVTFVGDNGAPQYKHPYEPEISTMQYPDRVFQNLDPIPPQPVETTAATWVDTYEGVVEMLQELKEAKEVAVDLEHHDFRTYVGLVSLLQISTREKDWVVDTLRPWRHKLQVLNEVFADPTIVKVFHGAYMDMVWLQRDLGLYVNGLFDTFFACEALHYSSRSLAFLLSKFVNFDADKRYQLADWRIRPLPEEMMYYARSDTHYLLYIYDRIRNDLVQCSDRNIPEKDLIGRVLEKSRELSLSRHENLQFNEETGEGSRGWFNFVLKNSHLAYKSEQFAVFRALWKWRDVTGRKEDENPNFVLGTNNLTEIARVNPPDAKALHSLLPLTASLARSRVNEIWSQLQEEKARGGPSLLQFFSSRDPASIANKNGIPRVAKPQSQTPRLDGEVTATRLARSQLFGDVAVSSQWDETKGATGAQEDYFPFPWQRFVEDVADVVIGTEPVQEPAAATEEPVNEATVPAAEDEKDEEFTLRRGKKRKSEAIESDEPISSGIESVSDGDEEMQDDVNDSSAVIEIEAEDLPPKSAKKAKKLEKKRKREGAKAAEEQQRLELRTKRHEEKLARKEQRKSQQKAESEARTKYQAVPFDYSKAASVLHVKRDEAKESAPEEKKKVFDPYAKTGDDEIKPARRMPPIRGEKSATFKK